MDEKLWNKIFRKNKLNEAIHDDEWMQGLADDIKSGYYALFIIGNYDKAELAGHKDLKVVKDALKKYKEEKNPEGIPMYLVKVVKEIK